jgi:hypothetical protein
MKKFTIQIQSISDVITNSSSETYLVISEDTIEQLKKITDGILGDGAHKLFNYRLNILGELYYCGRSSLESLEAWFEDHGNKYKEIYKSLKEVGILNILERCKDIDLDKNGEDEVVKNCSYNKLNDILVEAYYDNSYGWQSNFSIDPLIEVIPKSNSSRLTSIAKVLSNLPHSFEYEIRCD